MGRLPLAGNAFYALCCCYYIIFVCTYKNFFSPRSYRRVLCFSSVFSTVHQHTHETTSQDFVLGDSLSLFLRRRRRRRRMSFIWEASPLWRTIVRSTRDSRPLFFTFIASTFGASTLLWYGTQKFTNPQLDAHAVAKLRAKSGLDARVVSDVNKQRLGVLLKEVSQRDGASLEKQEKRWRDALDGRTTGDKDGTTKRHFGWK